MIHISQDTITCLCFHDSHVRKMELISKEKILKIFIGYADIVDQNNSFFKGRTSLELGEGILVFKKWTLLQVKRIDENGKNFEILKESAYEQIEEILKFEEGSDYVKIAGFGVKTGYWVEWIIFGSKYYGEFEEYDTES